MTNRFIGRATVFAFCVGLLNVAGTLSARAQDVAHIYELSFSGTILMSQSIGEDQEIIVKSAVSQAQVINLALGLNPIQAPPANAKLALLLVFPDEGNPLGQLVIFDTSEQSVMAELVDLDVTGVVNSAKRKGFAAMAGGVNFAGAFYDGWLAMTGKITVGEEDLLAFNANAVQGVLRSTDGFSLFEFLLSKGKIKLLGKLATIPLPE